MDGLFDFVGSDDPSTADAAGLTQRQRRMVGFQGLSQLGALLLAGGMPMPDSERARYIAQIGNVPGSMQDARSSMQREGVLANQQRRQKIEDDAIDAMRKDPRTEQLLQGMSPAQQLLARGALATGKFSNIGSAFGGSGSPMMIKEFEEWKKDPRFADKTYGDFIQWRANVGANKDAPAIVREFNVWKENPDNHYKTIDDFYREKALVTARGKEVGKTAGEAEMALPALDGTISQMSDAIERLKNHPGLPKAVGFNSYFPSIRGRDAANFEAMLDQLKGQAFLFQFDKLRGGGAITETEGKKATDALAALSLSQDEKQFRQNLELVMSILNKGREVVRRKAAKGETGGPQGPTPSTPGAAGPSREEALEELRRRGVIK
jgi:hypothetical protein